MLRATSSWDGPFRVRHEVTRDGRPVTGWSARTRQPYRDLVIDGQPYVLRAEGIARFALDGGIRAHIRRAAGPPLSTPCWTVEAGGLAYRLAGTGVGRRFSLLSAADAAGEVGRVWRTGWFPPSYAARLPDALALPVQVLVLWSAMEIWRAGVAAAGTAPVPG